MLLIRQQYTVFVHRDHGIRGRSRMSKRQLLEALEAVGAHETLQLEQCTGKGSK